MSERDLSMLVTHGEWEDLQAEVEKLRKQVKRYETGVEGIAWHCKDTLRISRPVNEEGV